MRTTDIEFYYTAYDITVNEKYILDERNDLVKFLLEITKRKETKTELNQIVRTNIINNAQKRHEKGFTANKRVTKIRLNKSYVENIKRLSDILVDTNSPNIMHELRKIKVSDEIFTDEVIDELDKLFA